MKNLTEQWVGPKNSTVSVTDWTPLPKAFPSWRPLGEPLHPFDEIAEARSNAPINVLGEDCKQRIREWWCPEYPGSDHWDRQRAKGIVRCSARHFHCYPIAGSTPARKSSNQAFTCWREHQSLHHRNSYDATIWWCSNFYNASAHYSWTTSKYGDFVKLSAALQSAMKLQDEELVAVCSKVILSWGGLSRAKSERTLTWIEQSAQRRDLITQIKHATACLCPQSSSSLSCFGDLPSQIPVTSGTTKIFAAAALDLSGGVNAAKQDVLILDGRVGAALGRIATMFSSLNDVPQEFLFPWGYGSYGCRRDPSLAGKSKFPKMESISNEMRAMFTRLGAQCIQDVLGIHRPSEDFALAERALFMIGYDVRNSCDTQPGSCHDLVGRTTAM